MTAQKTPKDWEAISAYLDDQLNPNERSRIEIRLQNEPDLRLALAELDKTRHILRNAPRLRAPRNFTLSPEMAGIRKGVHSAPGFYSGLRLASILATFFFVLVTAGSLILRNAAPSQTVVMQSGPQNAAPVPFGKGGGGGGGSGDLPPAAIAPTQEAFTAQMEENGGTPEALTIQVTPMADTRGALPEAPVQALAMPRESAVTDESPAAKQLPQMETPPQSEKSPTQIRAWSFIGVVQVILALLAVITGLAAFYFQRRTSH